VYLDYLSAPVQPCTAKRVKLSGFCARPTFAKASAGKDCKNTCHPPAGGTLTKLYPAWLTPVRQAPGR